MQKGRMIDHTVQRPETSAPGVSDQESITMEVAMVEISRSRWVFVIVLMMLIPLTVRAAGPANGAAGAEAMQDRSKKEPDSTKSQGPSGTVVTEQEDAQMSKPKKMPVYRPPLRGAPSGRVAGGTRGLGVDIPQLCALVPEHVGLTVNEQPLLYYFLSGPSALPLEFTLTERQAVYPLVEARIHPPQSAGIHAIDLADYDKHLKSGIQYRWFIALVPDDEHRAKDILASGAIELVSTSEGLKAKLKQANDTEAAYIYAEAGFWYDALADISEAIAVDRDNRDLLRQRASLLEQVGLSEASQYENERAAAQ